MPSIPERSHLTLLPPTIEEARAPYDANRQRDPFVMVDTATGETILATLGCSAFGVYWHLCKRSTDGKCWPSLDDIADATSLSRMHVTRMLSALETDGWIAREKRSNKHGLSTSTLYTILEKSRTYGCNIPVTCREPNTVRDVTRTRTKLDTNQNVGEPPLTPPHIESLFDEPTPEEPKPKREKPKRSNLPAYTEEFESFWSAYPKGHGSKVPSYSEWRKLSDEDRVLAVEALDAWKQSRRWREGFVRDAERYLKHRMFENPPEPEVLVSSNGYHKPDRPTKNGRVGYTREELLAQIAEGEGRERGRNEEGVVDVDGYVVR